MDFRQWKTNQW